MSNIGALCGPAENGPVAVGPHLSDARVKPVVSPNALTARVESPFESLSAMPLLG